MSDCLREERTKQELDAGLYERILKWREAVHAANETYIEIVAFMNEKDLDSQFAWREVPAWRIHPLI